MIRMHYFIQTTLPRLPQIWLSENKYRLRLRGLRRWLSIWDHGALWIKFTNLCLLCIIVSNIRDLVHNVRSIKCISNTRLKKFKKLKIVKLKGFKPNVFSCLNSRKRLVWTLLILQFLTFFSLVFEILLGTFIPWKDGKAKTAMAVDAGNVCVSCCVTKDKMLSVVQFSYRTYRSITLEHRSFS